MNFGDVIGLWHIVLPRQVLSQSGSQVTPDQRTLFAIIKLAINCGTMGSNLKVMNLTHLRKLIWINGRLL